MLRSHIIWYSYMSSGLSCHLSRTSLRTEEVSYWFTGHQDWLGLGHHCTHTVSWEAHSFLVQIVPAVLLTIPCKSNHTLFSSKDKYPWGTHQISPPFHINYQAHLDPWAKTIPQTALRFPRGEQPMLSFLVHQINSLILGLGVKKVCLFVCFWFWF